jgi:lipoyl synthase
MNVLFSYCGKQKDINPKIPAKSGVMSGLGEVVEELRETIADLLKNNCDILTLGQYSQSSQFHLPVERFVPPEELGSLRAEVLELGFNGVASSTTVRGSFEVGSFYNEVVKSI